MDHYVSIENVRTQLGISHFHMNKIVEIGTFGSLREISGERYILGSEFANYKEKTEKARAEFKDRIENRDYYRAESIKRIIDEMD